MTATDAISEMDKSEANGVAGAIKEALHRDYSPSFLETLQRRYDNLTGVNPFSAASEKEKERAASAVIGIAAVTYEQAIHDHERFASQGFNSKEDFFSFGKNLENDKYWDYLQDNPEERKKVADNCYGGLSDQLNSGKMNVHEVMETLTPRAIELGEGSEKARKLASELEAHRSEMTPQERQQHDALKAKANEAQNSEISSERSAANLNLREANVNILVRQDVDRAGLADNSTVGTSNVTASINDAFASFADLPGVETVKTNFKDNKLKDGEVVKNELTQEQANAQLAAANIQDRGEVQSTEPAPNGAVRTPSQVKAV